MQMFYEEQEGLEKTDEVYLTKELGSGAPD